MMTTRRFQPFFSPAVLLLSVVAAAGCQRKPAPPAATLTATIDAYLGSLPDDYGAVTPAALHEQMQSSRPFIVDVRDGDEIRSQGYIAGSVSLSIRSLMTSLDQLPGRGQPIVVSCTSGHRSAMAMAALQLLGYTNVRTLVGGVLDWKAANLPLETGTPQGADRLTLFRRWWNWRFRSAGSAADSSQELHAALDRYLSNLPGSLDMVPASILNDLLASSNPFQLDVRDVNEVADHGAIAGATRIPLRTLGRNLDKLPPDRHALIVTECGNGHRAAMAMLALNVLGYTDVKTLTGGLAAWSKAGLPLGK
jgi:rhodanese-related sulfurtransferase